MEVGSDMQYALIEFKHGSMDLHLNIKQPKKFFQLRCTRHSQGFIFRLMQ